MYIKNDLLNVKHFIAQEPYEAYFLMVFILVNTFQYILKKM